MMHHHSSILFLFNHSHILNNTVHLVGSWVNLVTCCSLFITQPAVLSNEPEANLFLMTYRQMVTSTQSTPPLPHGNILSLRPHSEQMPRNEKTKYRHLSWTQNHNKQCNILVIHRAPPLRVSCYSSAYGLGHQVPCHHNWAQLKRIKTYEEEWKEQ